MSAQVNRPGLVFIVVLYSNAMLVVTERRHNVLLCNPPADQAAGGRDLHCADNNKKSYRPANKRSLCSDRGGG